MSKETAEFVMVALSIACGAGGWYLHGRGQRSLGVLIFVSGAIAMALIGHHWNITAGL